MQLERLFPEGGRGVIATADAHGRVDLAIYARPRITGTRTLAWGLTEGRTWHNLGENPRAAFLYQAPGPGFEGVRVSLRLLRTEESGPMLEEVRERTAEIVGPGAAAAVRHVAYFEVEEVRPLV